MCWGRPLSAQYGHIEIVSVLRSFINWRNQRFVDRAYEEEAIREFEI